MHLKPFYWAEVHRSHLTVGGEGSIEKNRSRNSTLEGETKEQEGKFLRTMDGEAVKNLPKEKDVQGSKQQDSTSLPPLFLNNTSQTLISCGKEFSFAQGEILAFVPGS